MKKILLLMCILLLTGCKNNMYKKTMFYMDTYIEVKIYDIFKNKSNELFENIDNIYSEYHKLTDRYNSYDDLINIYYLNNRLDVNESIEISSKLSDVINYGIDAYNSTNGYVNIALGNVIDVWNKYRKEGKEVPKMYELTSLDIDINDINLKDNKYLKKKDVKLDLGSYAKGYVTEIVAKYLEDNDCNKYLINAGGNVRVGKSYKSDKFIVGLEEPFNTSNIYDTLSVENTSVVTSGSYQRYYKVDGIIYNHIINPKTLFPDNYTKSVTVITKDSGYADVL